jgi:hypothetical protein
LTKTIWRLPFPSGLWPIFLGKVHPDEYAKLFPGEVYRSHGTNATRTEPILPDVYLHGDVSEPVRAAPKVSPGTIERRQQESPAIVLLRSKAQSLADNMKNFIAVERLSFGSGGNDFGIVAVRNQSDRWRPKVQSVSPQDAKKYRGSPSQKPTPAIEVGSEWSDLPDMVGTSLGLKIAQVEDAFVDGTQNTGLPLWRRDRRSRL